MTERAENPIWLNQLKGWNATGVEADSRKVRPGTVFVALPGVKQDGRAYIAQAVQQGAVAVIAPEGTVWPDDVPVRPMVSDAEPRRALALLAAHFGGAQPRLIAAVTGTNGKTSTVDFLRQLWTARGARAASIGTLGVRAPDWQSDHGLTTPDPVMLAQYLARLAEEAVDLVAMEASSHGLDQFRLDGVQVSAGAFTNLTRDHLDYHADMAAYRTAKLRLFADLLPTGAVAAVNADMDTPTLAALREIAANKGLRLIETGERGADLRVLDVTPRADGQTVTVEAFGAKTIVSLGLAGRFQADNALLAAAIAIGLGDEAALDRLGSLRGVRGRMELAAQLPNGAAAYVDYAHTPDALETVLRGLRPHTQGRLFVVFGAGGDRDRGKRPLMGAAATRYADQVIVTDDNPRSEDALQIRAEVISGCQGAWSVPGRAKAIGIALNALAAGDVLVVAGKGHEQGQIIGSDVIPFDDVAVIQAQAGINGPGEAWPGTESESAYVV